MSTSDYSTFSKEGLKHVCSQIWTEKTILLAVAIVVVITIIIVSIWISLRSKKQNYTVKPKYVARKKDTYMMPRDALNFSHPPFPSIMQDVEIGGQRLDDSVGDRQAGPLTSDNRNEDVEASLFAR